MSIIARISAATKSGKLWLGLLLLSACASAQAGEITKKPILKPTFDPNAEKKELFAAIEDGSITYKMIMKSSKQGTLLLENKTSAPISVEIPNSLVGVHVLPQFGGMGMGGMGMGGGMGGMGMGGGMGGMGGGQQSVGGGNTGSGGGGMGNTGGGGGFFNSIPAEKVIAVPLNTVCLEYGKHEPSPQATYKLVKTEEYTNDETLKELIGMVARGSLNQDVAQAAVWHVGSNISWQELASKQTSRFSSGGQRPVYSPAHLMAARNLVLTAEAIAQQKKTEEKPAKERNDVVIPPRTSRLAK